MANKVQKFVNNKKCCIASKVKSTDKKLQYGSQDVMCCINKDIIANMFIELLQCNPFSSDLTWYKGTLVMNWLQPSIPVSLPGNFTMPSDVMLTSVDGNQSVIIPWSGTYTANTLEDVNIILNTIVNDALNTLDNFSSNIEFEPSTGKSTFTFIFSEEWMSPGNYWDITDLSNGTTPFDLIIYGTIDNEIVGEHIGCFTMSELCSIKKWIDNYCKSCL